MRISQEYVERLYREQFEAEQILNKLEEDEEKPQPDLGKEENERRRAREKEEYNAAKKALQHCKNRISFYFNTHQEE